MTNKRDEMAGPEPEDDQVTEIEVAEDEAEQVKGGPQTSSFHVNIG